MARGDRPTPLRIAIRIGAALFFFGFVLVSAVLQRLSFALPLLYLGMGLVSAMLYALDKQAAIRGEWRMPEGRLHTVDLFFGIAGGLIAQGVLRHKSSKLSFSIVTAVIFGIHLIGVAALIGLFGVIDPRALAPTD